MSMQRLIDRRRWMPGVFVEECVGELIITAPADSFMGFKQLVCANETRKVLLSMLLNGMAEVQRLKNSGQFREVRE